MRTQSIAVILLSILPGLFTALTSPGHAAVIETQDWESTPGSPWQYSGGFPVFSSSQNSPSGGRALQFTYPAGSYSSSISGGIAERVGTLGSEIYVGHWIKWSSPYDWNPIGTKLVYQAQDGPDVNGAFRDNFLFFVRPGGTELTFTQQLQQYPNTQNRYMNTGSVTFALNTWYWFEYHCVENTVGQANGLLEVWVNGVQVMRHTDVTYRTNNRQFGSVLLGPEWGGGGGVINQTQYYWMGHTVISTTRIGMPGTTPSGGDTTPPATPAGLRIQ